jgi:hypothetical protein
MLNSTDVMNLEILATSGAATPASFRGASASVISSRTAVTSSWHPTTHAHAKYATFAANAKFAAYGTSGTWGSIG